MFSGYVMKRDTPISPPSMLKTYCVLYGTMLLDYESNEAAETSMTPRCVAEIIGVSDWDGKGRANKYQNAFLVVTHTGGNYYMCAP